MSKKLNERLTEAGQLAKQGEYEKALKQVDRLLSAEPLFIDAHMLCAEILFRTDEIEGSAAAMEKVLALDSFYLPRNLYSLARLYDQLKQYPRAERLLARYLDLVTIGERGRARLNREYALLKTKKELVEHPVHFKPELLGPEINSVHDEALPAFTVDGIQMVFTRREGRQEDLYSSRWNELESVWTPATPLATLNTEYNEGAHAISADGKVVAFTSCGRRNSIGSCDIYVALQRPDGTWTRARNIEEINTRGWDGQPSLTADGRGMYFSSDRAGGLGKRDIWFTERGADGQWLTPVNLGSEINTAGNESSPFLHFDDRSLYFMSDGHAGMGDYDLFVTHFDGISWEQPKKMGYPINTEGREGALSVHPNGEDAYYTAPGASSPGQRPNTDIYLFKLPLDLRASPVSYLYGIVKDLHTGFPIEARVEIYQLDRPEKTFRYRSDDSGRFVAALTHGVTYGVHVRSEGYVFYSDQFALDSDAPYGAELLEAELIPVSQPEIPVESKPVVLRNIQFETNSSKLLKSSMPELNRLLQLLHDNAHLAIDIIGHTDSIGAADANQRLSEERARAVYEWLVDKGVQRDRLAYLGYGEAQPMASNETENGRTLNRRTEFLLRRQ